MGECEQDFILLLWKRKLKEVEQFAGAQTRKRLEHKPGPSDSRPHTLTHFAPLGPPHRVHGGAQAALGKWDMGVRVASKEGRENPIRPEKP